MVVSSVITVLLVSLLLPAALCQNERQPPLWDSLSGGQLRQLDESVTTTPGPSTSSSSSSTTFEDPLRHHVDFNERHPGEDLLAVEDHEFPAVTSVPPQWAGGEGSTTFSRPPPDVPRVNNHQHPLWNLISPRFFRQWWRGSNVCIKREEEDDGEGSQNGTNVGSTIVTSVGGHPELTWRFSACEDLDLRHTCVTRIVGPSVSKTITTNYECCPGYALNVKEQECQRGRFQNIAKTMGELGASEFSQLVKSVGLTERLEREQNLTIFVPIDEAVRAYLSKASAETNVIPVTLYNNNEGIRRRRNVLLRRGKREDGRDAIYHGSRNGERNMGPMSEEDGALWSNAVLDQQDEFRRQTAYSPNPDNTEELTDSIRSHIISGKMSTDDFVDERVIYSDKDSSVLRMNTWDVAGEKVNTINCARMTSVNHGCSNGMIHLIDQMLTPVTQSLAETLESDPNLSTFFTLIRRAGMYEMLTDPHQHITVLAPTNAALNRLGPELMRKMHSGDPCLKRIVRHHILPISLCSSIIQHKGRARNVNHELLMIERDSEDKLFINGSQLISRDLVTTNGVVHVIDGVLLSDRDEPLTRVLEKAGLSSFLQYVQLAGFSLESLHNVTVFAPSNEALDTLPQEIRSNPDRLREIIEYHIGVGEIRACHFSHQEQIPSKLANRSIRMNLYSNFPFGMEAEVTAQCGRLTKVNDVACNGIIHTVDRVLIPPDMDIAELLRTQNDHSILNRLIAESGMIEALRSSGPITLFAPTDQAFYKLPREELERILRDPELGKSLLKSHIVQGDSLCCAGVLPMSWFMTKRVETMNGQHVPVSRDSTGQVKFGSAAVTTCDLTASNGVIHTVDSIFKAEQSPMIGTSSILRASSCEESNLGSCELRRFIFLG